SREAWRPGHPASARRAHALRRGPARSRDDDRFSRPGGGRADLLRARISEHHSAARQGVQPVCDVPGSIRRHLVEGEAIAREGMSGFGRAIRDRFMLEDGVAFLNNGSYGATPRAVFDAVLDWRRRVEAEPVRFYAREAMPALAAARDALAARIGADADG